METNRTQDNHPTDHTGLYWADTAATNEGRSDVIELWTSWSTSTIFRLAQSIPAIVVSLNTGDLNNGRAETFKLFAKSIKHIISTDYKAQKLCFGAMIFLVKNTGEKDTAKRVEENVSSA